MFGYLTRLNRELATPGNGGIDGFLIDVLITFRVASLVTFRSGDKPGSHRVESGPFGIMDKFRDFAGVTYDELGRAIQDRQPNELAKVLTCMWCSTVWIGFIVGVLKGKGLAYGLALSAAALMIEYHLRKT